MWRWLLISVCVLEGVGAAFPLPGPSLALAAITTGQGTRNAEEASVLWREGQADFEGGRFLEAIHHLQRLVDRYPGSPSYTEAHLLLGKAYLESGKPAKALKPLKYYLEAQGKSDEAQPTRLLLGEAYLRLRQFNEAYLLSLEITRRADESLAAQNASATPSPDATGPKPPVPARDFRISGLLLKSRALSGLEQRAPAKRAWESAQSELDQHTTAAPATRGAVASIGIELKARDCGLLGTRGPLTEEQARHQLSRRGDCVKEAFLLYREVLKSEDPSWLKRATLGIQLILTEYQEACLNPPSPPGKRTQAQLTQYKTELVQLLKQDCQQKHKESQAMLESWKEAHSSGVSSQVKQVTQALTRTW